MDDADEFDEVDEGEEEGHSEPEVTIEISGLSLFTHVGVTAAEREVGQRLLLDMRIDVGPCDVTVSFGSSSDHTTPKLTAAQFIPKYLEEISSGVARASRAQ